MQVGGGSQGVAWGVWIVAHNHRSCFDGCIGHIGGLAAAFGPLQESERGMSGVDIP
jgi:hypothetical protein